MSKFIIILLAMFFICPSALGSNAGRNNDKIDVKVNDATKLLMSNDSLDKQHGEQILAEFTGISIKARYLLGVWLIKNPIYKYEKIKMGVSLINSAHCEGYIKASYFMVNVYERNGRKDIYKMKNENKALTILKNILISGKDYSANEESLLGKLLLKQDPIKNKREAMYWLGSAVEHGDVFSFSTLAPLFTQGEEKDLVKAWCYSDLGGTAMASEKHALEDQMSSEQIEQAQQMSWNWQDAHHVHMPGYRGQESRIRWQVESN